MTLQFSAFQASTLRGQRGGHPARTYGPRTLHLPLLRDRRVHLAPGPERQVRTRRLNGRGYIKLGGLQRAVGREHAGKMVTVVIEEGIATVLDGDRVLRRIVLQP
jgi:hypothetical protein